MSSIHSIQFCRNCNLCFNQKPLLDNLKEASIFWIGLSAVKVERVENETPLSKNTNSGKLISRIEEELPELSYYKSNLVKCLPLEKEKIRYPKANEMKSCYQNLQLEIMHFRPKIVFLLGKLVSDFILNMELAISSKLDESFNYEYHTINNTRYIPIHHPSYMLVYKRKFIDNYISSISNLALNVA